MGYSLKVTFNLFGRVKILNNQMKKCDKYIQVSMNVK